MPRGPNLLTTMSLAAAIILLGTRVLGAQERAPDPRMLLDLDLFTPPANGNPALGHGNGASMLDQIRALRAMGYLGGHGPSAPLPANPAMAAPPPPPSNSEDEVEE
jgi:hypothetical protein